MGQPQKSEGLYDQMRQSYMQNPGASFKTSQSTVFNDKKSQGSSLLNDISRGSLSDAPLKVTREKSTTGKTSFYYNGIPKTLLKSKGDSICDPKKVDKDKLNYAKAKWLQKRGVNVLQIDRNSEEESRKLFRYIDFNNDGVIGKNQVRLFLAFIDGEFKNPQLLDSNQVIRQLKQITTFSCDANINEELFAQMMSKTTIPNT